MSLDLQQLGLYFGRAHIENPHTEPLKTALAFLTAKEGEVIGQRPAPTRKNKANTEPILKRTLTSQEQLPLNATRYALFHDPSVGQKTTQALFASEVGFHDHATLAATAAEMVSAIQIANLLYAEPSFNPQAEAWYTAMLQRYERLDRNKQLHGADFAWLQTLTLILGVVFDNQAFVQEAVQNLKAQINTIHPEGYLKSAVEGDDPLQTFEQTLAAVGALVIAAEVAEQTGESLWGYDNRGVSVQTAVAYVVSHYFYPQKWRWGGALTEEQVKPLYIRDGAFLEIAHARNPIHATQLLLNDLRPLFSVHYGGLTTLTHAKTAEEPPKKRGWLW
jgi:hypothetical protein